MPVLLVKTKDDTRIYQLPEGKPLFIGRAKECDIVLPSQAVSRRHAAVVFKNGICGVKDLGSFNGCIINGSAISGASRLREEDILKISSYIIRFVMRDESVESAASSGGSDAPTRAKSPRPDSRTFANGLRLPRAMAMADEVDALIDAIPPNANRRTGDTLIFKAGSQTATFLKNEEGAVRADAVHSAGETDRIERSKPDTTRKIRKDGVVSESHTDSLKEVESTEDADEPLSSDDTEYFQEPPPVDWSPPPEPAPEKTEEENALSLKAEEIIPLLEPDINPVLQLDVSETEEKDETHTALEKLIEDDVETVDASELPPLGADEYTPPVATDEFPATGEGDSNVNAEALRTGDRRAVPSDPEPPALGLDKPPLSPALMEAIGTRLALYMLLNDLAEERKLIRMAHKDMAPDLIKELDRQEGELDCLPTTEEAEANIQELRRQQAERPDVSDLHQSIDDMAVSQWLLIRDSNREALPPVYKQAYKLAVDEPLARELTTTRIPHGRLFGGAVYLLALESLVNSMKRKRTRISTRIRKLAEEGAEPGAGGVLSRLGKIADSFKNRAEARQEAERLAEQDRESALKASFAAREAAFMEKFLVREFRQVYSKAALQYIPDAENMPLPVRAFLRHGAIGFKSWWMRRDVRDFIISDCKDNVVQFRDQGPGALNVLYADEYLSAVASMDCSPMPDDSLTALEKRAAEKKADRAYRRIVNSHNYTVLMKELIANLDTRVKALELESKNLEDKIREVKRRTPGGNSDTLFELQTEQQTANIRHANLKGHIQRIVKEVVSSIIDSVQEAEGRFRKGEYKLPAKDTLIRHEVDSLMDLSRRMGGPKERFLPMIIRDHYFFNHEILNNRDIIRTSIEECERRDPNIFMNTIVPAKKKINRVEFRFSPTVVIVPSFGLNCVCALAREGMEGGHLVLPSCFARENARNRQLANLLADFRWETAKNHAGRDVLNSDTLVGAFMKIRWDWRNLPKTKREKGLILNELSDQHNWRRVYELCLADAMTGCRQLFLRNPDCYFAIIGKYIDLPDGVRMLRRGSG